MRCPSYPVYQSFHRTFIVLPQSHVAHVIYLSSLPLPPPPSLPSAHVICIVWETMSASQHQLLSREAGEIIGACLAAVVQHMAFLFMNTVVAWIASFFIRIKEAERKAFIIMSSQKSLPTAVVIISYMGGGAPSHRRRAARMLLSSAMSAVMPDSPLAPPDGPMSPMLPFSPMLPPSSPMLPFSPMQPSSHPMLPPMAPHHDDDYGGDDNDNALDPGLMAIPCIVFYVLQLFIDTFIATGWASKYERANELRAKYSVELEELAKMDPEAGATEDGGVGAVAGAVTKPEDIKARVASKSDLAAEARDEDDTVGLLSKPRD